MKYYVEFTITAKKDLKKIDKNTAAFLTGWIRKNLEGCEDPRRHGKPLTGNHSGVAIPHRRLQSHSPN